MRPPAAFRRLETMVLMRAFGRAFGVEVPLLRGLTADDALGTYREFTATCMEMALADKRLAEALRPRLGAEALRASRPHGALVRPAPPCMRLRVGAVLL